MEPLRRDFSQDGKRGTRSTNLGLDVSSPFERLRAVAVGKEETIR
jgi:hypothetical protein